MFSSFSSKFVFSFGNGHTDRQTDRRTDRQTDKQTNRQTDKHPQTCSENKPSANLTVFAPGKNTKDFKFFLYKDLHTDRHTDTQTHRHIHADENNTYPKTKFLGQVKI